MASNPNPPPPAPAASYSEKELRAYRLVKAHLQRPFFPWDAQRKQMNVFPTIKDAYAQTRSIIDPLAADVQEWFNKPFLKFEEIRAALNDRIVIPEQMRLSSTSGIESIRFLNGVSVDHFDQSPFPKPLREMLLEMGMVLPDVSGPANKVHCKFMLEFERWIVSTTFREVAVARNLHALLQHEAVSWDYAKHRLMAEKGAEEKLDPDAAAQLSNWRYKKVLPEFEKWAYIIFAWQPRAYEGKKAPPNPVTAAFKESPAPAVFAGLTVEEAREYFVRWDDMRHFLCTVCLALDDNEEIYWDGNTSSLHLPPDSVMDTHLFAPAVHKEIDAMTGDDLPRMMYIYGNAIWNCLYIEEEPSESSEPVTADSLPRDNVDQAPASQSAHAPLAEHTPHPPPQPAQAQPKPEQPVALQSQTTVPPSMADEKGIMKELALKRKNLDRLIADAFKKEQQNEMDRKAISDEKKRNDVEMEDLKRLLEEQRLKQVAKEAELTAKECELQARHDNLQQIITQEVEKRLTEELAKTKAALSTVPAPASDPALSPATASLPLRPAPGVKKPDAKAKSGQPESAAAKKKFEARKAKQDAERNPAGANQPITKRKAPVMKLSQPVAEKRSCASDTPDTQQEITKLGIEDASSDAGQQKSDLEDDASAELPETPVAVSRKAKTKGRIRGFGGPDVRKIAASASQVNQRIQPTATTSITPAERPQISKSEKLEKVAEIVKKLDEVLQSGTSVVQPNGVIIPVASAESPAVPSQAAVTALCDARIEELAEAQGQAKVALELLEGSSDESGREGK